MKQHTAPTQKDAGQASASGRFMPLLLGAIAFLTAGLNIAQAYPNEVYLTGGTYRWKINNVEIGSTPSLATAISNCIWNSTGVGREIHVLVGGTLTSTIGLPPDVKLFGHANTFTIAHPGIAVWCKGVNNIAVHDMTVNSAQTYVFRISRCNNVNLSGININGGFIGMRIESSDSSSPWNFTSTNLTVNNCRFENLYSHGLETYGFDGVTINNIVARNNGECGVLLNNTRNGTVGTVDAYRCSYGGGYAGLRLANNSWNITISNLIATECGRGFFTVSTVKNCTLQNATIRGSTGHAILLQNSDNVVVAAGTYTGEGLNHYTSVNCQINAVPLGLRRINSVATGRVLDVNGNADGSLLRVMDWTGVANQKWDIADVGGSRFSIRTTQTGARALDSGLTPANGTGAKIWSYLNNTAQKWQIQSIGNSQFRVNSHINTALCLDTNGTAAGSPVILWSYWGGTNQKWTIQYL